MVPSKSRAKDLGWTRQKGEVGRRLGPPWEMVPLSSREVGWELSAVWVPVSWGLPGPPAKAEEESRAL